MDVSGSSVEKTNNYSKYIETSDGQIPFLKDLWSFYSSKGVKTSFFSINPENSFELDLLISEGLGCPIRILTNKESIEQKWSIIQRTLKARSIQEEDKQYDWLKGVEKKWILPKNIHIKRDTLGWATWKDNVTNIPENRVDICKIEGNNDDERILLYSLFDYISLLSYSVKSESAIHDYERREHVSITLEVSDDDVRSESGMIAEW